jgi:aspartyl-tRNA(Asn)/glutamyl-tRNA(Gln) amidotransferase subunit C
VLRARFLLVSMPTPRLDRAQIDHVAKLSALSLTNEEADALMTDLDAILAYVAELDLLDTSGVPPTANVQQGSISWREDEVKPGLPHDEALAEAPRTAEGGFAVPAFVDAHGSER